MAEWLIEEGIGETRALLVEAGEVLAAKLFWPGELRAGTEIAATLTHKSAGSRRGVATTDKGVEVLVDRLPPDVTEGAPIALTITRAPISERGRPKRAQGVVGGTGGRDTAVQLDGKVVRRFPSGLWEEVWDEAASNAVAFPGGSLLISVTPAMVLIDIDGDLPPRTLALAAVPAIAQALRRFDIGGSIGIDFPTLPDKADRKAVDAALEQALTGWPHERTAMNGFGFVQIVARLEGPSLLHRFVSSRVGACARIALRRAEAVEGPGALLLTVHPALKAKLKPQWVEELARRTGREVRIATDPALALDAAFAQSVPL